MLQSSFKAKSKKASWSLLLVLAAIIRLSIVFYVQDSQVAYNPGTPSLYLLSSLSPGWVSSTKYAMGLWLNKISWYHSAAGWDMIATIIQNDGDNSHRSLIIQLHPTNLSCFVASTPNNWPGDLVPWEGLPGTSLSPVGTWVFFATGVDSVAQINYGFRYYLSSASSTYQYLGTRSDSFYTLSYANTALNVGGIADPNYPDTATFGTAYGYMQYMRLFLDYTPTTVDEFLNIALMDSASNLYLFYFASDSGTNNNQTFIVSSVSSSSQINTVGDKGFDTSVSSQDLSFGPYNILMCRPGQIASFPLDAKIIKKGLVVALDFYPHSSTQATQAIFSIRDTATNIISLRFDYFASSGALDVLINPVSSIASTTPYYAFSSTGVSVPAVTTSSWNRVIVEIIQTQPLETGTGFSSARIWVNSVLSARTHFGKFATGDTAIADGNSAALDVCGAYDSNSVNLVSTTLTGNFDILNMLWITGAEGAFQNSTDAGCEWRVFIAPYQTSCLRCATGYYMQDNQECVSSASSNSYFLHSPTNSYQKCYYGQYYNISSGICSECTGDGQLISSPLCINCDPSCRLCTGTAVTQCTACYNGAYLYKNTCETTCPNGFYPNPTDSACYACDSSCATCTSSRNTSCTSCKSGTYLYSNTCVPTCPNAYYPNSTDWKCYYCDPSCATCNTLGVSNCTTCNAGYFLSTNSTGSYCLRACPFGYIPDHSSNQCETSLVNISQAQSGILVATPVVTSIALTVSSVISGGFSINIMMCLVAAESIANMQYLNINHSNIASTIYSGMSTSPVPNWIARLNTLQPDKLIFNWGIFKQNQISSLYLDNFGDSLTEIMLYVAVLLLALFFALFSNTDKLITSFTGKAYLAAFSLLVSNILGNMQGQILFCILQMIRIDLALDAYSILSLIMGYLTMSISVGLIVFCFFRLESIFIHIKRQERLQNRSSEEISKDIEYSTQLQHKWLEKKYEFMFGSFKHRNPHQFFFAYWIIALDAAFILLILSFQSIPVLQCLSIVVLVLAFIMFSAIIKPFKKSHQLSCTFSTYPVCWW